MFWSLWRGSEGTFMFIVFIFGRLIYLWTLYRMCHGNGLSIPVGTQHLDVLVIMKRGWGYFYVYCLYLWEGNLPMNPLQMCHGNGLSILVGTHHLDVLVIMKREWGDSYVYCLYLWEVNLPMNHLQDVPWKWTYLFLLELNI